MNLKMNDKDSEDMIFTAVSQGAFDTYKEAEQCVAFMYVPDMNFTRHGICLALKRLKKFYEDKDAA